MYAVLSRANRAIISARQRGRFGCAAGSCHPMHEPAETDDIAAPVSGSEREPLVEQLLLSGLDHYFAGQYERAVHVWTRVLFLDRGHARARAYIERARAADAERLRQSDELLHRGTTAFERGQTGAARRLLTAAVERGAPTEVALSYLDRLDRLAQPPKAGPLAAAEAEPLPVGAGAARPSPSRPGSWSFATGAMTFVGAAALIGFGWALAGHAPWATRPASGDAVTTLQDVSLPTVRPSEVALARARVLFDTGHPGDAIRLLDTIAVADVHRAEADRLLAEIQRALLSAAGPEGLR
jgi:hypothetical protein